MTNDETKQLSKQTTSRIKRSPALVPSPEQFALFMRLANLLPKSLRRYPPSSSNASEEKRGLFHWEYVREWWSTKNYEETASSTYHLWRLVDELPLELQAFVLHDEEGLFIEVEYFPKQAPVFDPSHFQPLTNIALLGQSPKKLGALVARAKERIDVETKLAESKASSSKKTDVALISPWAADYQIRDCKFREMGLAYLAGRARRRIFFILAAEELLDALVGPDVHKKLHSNWYVDKSGAATGFLYVSGDEVRLYPPLLFSFVVGVQASRVRRCGICENYFWAGRKDKKVCSERCSATSRKRQERQRYFEKKIGVRRRKDKKRKAT